MRKGLFLLLSLLLLCSTVDASQTKTSSNINSAAVLNGGKSPTLQLFAPSTVMIIKTYHWNGGRGAPAGSISLKRIDGQVFGPWLASPISGNWWEVKPEIKLPAGSYMIIDSEPSTWSQNIQSDGKGIAEVTFITEETTACRTIAGSWTGTYDNDVKITMNIREDGTMSLQGLVHGYIDMLDAHTRSSFIQKEQFSAIANKRPYDQILFRTSYDTVQAIPYKYDRGTGYFDIDKTRLTTRVTEKASPPETPYSREAADFFITIALKAVESGSSCIMLGGLNLTNSNYPTSSADSVQVTRQ